MTITKGLQDRGEGLTRLSNESVSNSIPRLSQLFPRRNGHHQTKVISSIPSQALLSVSTIRQKSSIPQLRKGHQYKYLRPEDGDLFPSRVPWKNVSDAQCIHYIISHHIPTYNFHSASYTLHHFITYTCIQCSHLFQAHNSLITSFHSIRMHTTFASHAS